MTTSSNGPHGVVVIDKPKGPTSHDVVARMRKELGTRAVGHAGTLDPAATGVLVVAVGEATKLSPYLTTEKKAYRATVTFGAATTTLDAEGDVVATAPIPADLARELQFLGAEAETLRLLSPDSTPLIARAIGIECARRSQVPPAFSAIKTGGQRAHALARRGDDVTLAPREVAVATIAMTGASPTSLGLEIVVSKGYYVRALARDLGVSLGVPSHLSSLRRTASGTFTLDEALPLSATREELLAALLTVAEAARRILPAGILSEEGERRARYGQHLSREHFSASPAGDVSAWFGPAGDLIAIGRETDRAFTVMRGFAYPTSTAST